MANTTTETTATGGSVLEALTAIGGVVLAIIGLASVARDGMAGAATIVIGAALILEGGALMARMRGARRHEEGERIPLGGTGAIDILAGVAGVVLGAFALAGFAPLVLLPVANIVFGGTILLVGFGSAEVHRRRAETGLAVEQATSSPELLGGAAAITLGILALAGVAPMVLSLIALLAVGASVLLGGPGTAGAGWQMREPRFGGRHEIA